MLLTAGGDAEIGGLLTKGWLWPMKGLWRRGALAAAAAAAAEAGDGPHPRWSSYDEGCVGGDSPIRLMRFPGDPASPPPPRSPLPPRDDDHSFVMFVAVVLGAVDEGAKDAVEMASRSGEVPRRRLPPLGGRDGDVGFISGVCTGGVDSASEVGALPAMLPLLCILGFLRKLAAVHFVAGEGTTRRFFPLEIAAPSSLPRHMEGNSRELSHMLCHRRDNSTVFGILLVLLGYAVGVSTLPYSSSLSTSHTIVRLQPATTAARRP